MRKPTSWRLRLGATITVVIIAWIQAGYASASLEQITLSAESREAIEMIRRDSVEPAQFWVDEGLRQVTRARFNIWVPSRFGGNTAEAANWIVGRNRSLLRGVGLEDLSLPYTRGGVGDLNRVVYLQEYQELPVEGAGVVVNVLVRRDHIEAIGIENLTVPDLDLDVSQTIRNGISLEDALDTIATVEIDDTRLFGTPALVEYELVISFAPDPKDGSTLSDLARVVFQIVATSGNDFYLFLVDVHSGEVLRFTNYKMETETYTRDVRVFDWEGI